MLFSMRWQARVAAVIALLWSSTGIALSMPDITQQQIEEGRLSLRVMQRLGEQVFAFPFTKADGYGDLRGTLQATPWTANQMFRRIGGLDAQTCMECHGLHSNAVIPATQMVGGSGTITQSVFFMPQHIDMGSDEHSDISFDGRVINPPHLFGAGGVELVAKEMTRNLQQIALDAQQNPGTEYPLETHGVSFGTITYQSGPGCMSRQSRMADARAAEASRGAHWARINPQLRAPLAAESDVCADTSGIEGIDEDLVVKPFGRKGSNFTTRDFDRGAMEFHFGIQPVEVFGSEDMDQDQVFNEITIGQMSLLAIFSTTLPPPTVVSERNTYPGYQIFQQVGCAECHVPPIETESRKLTYSFPELATDPDANVFYQVNLSHKKIGFSKAGQGVLVPMFSDLKRHDMGDRLMENLVTATDEENRQFITARLWGIADSAPYLHDGRAPTLHEAITYHGGEAQQARDNYLDLSEMHQQCLLDFLGSLRSPRLPSGSQQRIPAGRCSQSIFP